MTTSFAAYAEAFPDLTAEIPDGAFLDWSAALAVADAAPIIRPGSLFRIAGEHLYIAESCIFLGGVRGITPCVLMRLAAGQPTIHQMTHCTTLSVCLNWRYHPDNSCIVLK